MNEDKKEMNSNNKKIIIRKDDKYEGKSCIDFLILSLKEMMENIDQIHSKISTKIDNQNKSEILKKNDEKIINEEFDKIFKTKNNNKEEIFDILNKINKNHIFKYKKIFKFLNLNLIVDTNHKSIDDMKIQKLEKNEKIAQIGADEQDNKNKLKLTDGKDNKEIKEKNKEEQIDKCNKEKKKNNKICEKFTEKFNKPVHKNSEQSNLKDKNKNENNKFKQNKLLENKRDDDNELESEIIINENDDSIIPFNFNEYIINNQRNKKQNIVLKNTSNTTNTLIEQPTIINNNFDNNYLIFKNENKKDYMLSQESFNNKSKNEIKNENSILNNVKSENRDKKENISEIFDSKCKNNIIKTNEYEQKSSKRVNSANNHTMNLAYTGFDDKDEICTCIIF